MNEPTIILQGITIEQFMQRMYDTIQQAQNEGKNVIVSKAEASRQLGMNIRTVDRAISQLGLQEPLTNKSVDRIKKEYVKNKRN